MFVRRSMVMMEELAGLEVMSEAKPLYTETTRE
jgi:hypothetical protein